MTINTTTTTTTDIATTTTEAAEAAGREARVQGVQDPEAFFNEIESAYGRSMGRTWDELRREAGLDWVDIKSAYCEGWREADEAFIDRLAEAVDDAAAEWIGCDWTVEGLPLDGERAADWVPAAQAVQVAGRLGDLPRQIGGISRRTLLLHAMDEEDDAADPPPRGSTLGEWSQAARDAWGPGGPSRLLHAAIDMIQRSAEWLTDVDADAEAAAVEGRAALDAARRGEMERALHLAESACYIEAQYGDCPAWRPVRALIRERIRAQD